MLSRLISRVISKPSMVRQTKCTTGSTARQLLVLSRYFHASITDLEPNPFKYRTFEEIHEILVARGFKTKGHDPAAGKGSYFHPDSGRKYYLDQGGHETRYGVELAHVDVHNMPGGNNHEKKKHRYPLADSLFAMRLPESEESILPSLKSEH